MGFSFFSGQLSVVSGQWSAFSTQVSFNVDSMRLPLRSAAFGQLSGTTTVEIADG